ncbi:hypothetical protein BH11MYX2_BH11MYX2_39170 [soil metagenome]
MIRPHISVVPWARGDPFGPLFWEEQFMNLKRLLLGAGLLAGAGVLGATQIGQASDHDDGETDIKSRALNITDHYAFKQGSNLVLIMYVNPRSLPGRQYNLSTNARYDIHVSKVADKLATPGLAEDFVFRFEAGAPVADGSQPITLTEIKSGTAGTPSTGSSATFGVSQANSAVAGSAGPDGSKFWVGMRADSFTFDVQRFFQVRTYLATRFFGGPGGVGNAAATLAPNCKGQAFLGGQTVLGGLPDPDNDNINLWNPSSCAPDFTHNYNVTALVLEVPIASLGGTVFDTWSTISVKQ